MVTITEPKVVPYEKGLLYTLELNQLTADPDQPRKYLDAQALDELTSSIRTHGILEPILFRRDELGNLIVVAGERRVEAARRAGMETIPAIFIEGNHAEIALVENLLRQDLTPVEEAEAIEKVMKDQGYRQEDLSRMIGQPQPRISETLSLTRLPQQIRDECRQDPSVPRYILIEIAKNKQQRGMLSLYNKYKAKRLSQQQLIEQSRTQRKTKAEAALLSIDSLCVRLAGLDPAVWSSAERQGLKASLEKLKQAVDGQLSALQIPEPAAAARPVKAATKKKKSS